MRSEKLSLDHQRYPSIFRVFPLSFFFFFFRYGSEIKMIKIGKNTLESVV